MSNEKDKVVDISKHLAYGPDRHALEAVMRMHSVKRWHMIDTTRQQTLAEHSANVAMLIALLINQLSFTRGTGLDLIKSALIHDLPEAFTGDVSTITKKFITGLASLEEAVTPYPFSYMVNADEEALVKICDLADGIRFIRLHGVDITARHAREGLEKQLYDMFDKIIYQLKWSAEDVRIVRSTVMFYAYENS